MPMNTLSALKKYAERSLRYAFAYSVIIILFVLNVIALPYPFNGPIKVPLVLMGIYYWSVYRPAVIPPWLTFIIGLLMDIVSGLPLGLNAFVFNLFQWVTMKQRRVLTGQSYFVVWTGFAALISAALALQWCLFGLIYSWPGFKPFMVSSGLSITAFPLVSLILHTSHKILPLPEPLKLFKQDS